MFQATKQTKTVEEAIKQRKEKRRQKTDRFIAKLEKKLQTEGKNQEDESSTDEEVTSPTKKLRTEQTLESEETKPALKSTLSIALPCSILDNCQSLELKCYLASMIARSAVIFGVDEIVIFNDTVEAIPATSTGEYALVGKHAHSALMLGSILQYMECPPYMRKFLFPHKWEFEMASNMNPLNIPHHNAEVEQPLFREGIISTKTPKPGKGSYVNVGLKRDVGVDRLLEQGVRVTIKMEPAKPGQKKMRGTIVSPITPKLEKSLYWGYTVRLAKNFNEVFTGCPYGKKYDLIIGTSDKGESVDDVKPRSFKNALVIFGGLQGLEAVIEADETITASDPSKLFTLYLNTCPTQGSRTIRTEEAILISLASLQGKII